MLVQQLHAVFALVTVFLIHPIFALPKITRTGKYLYDESGARFFIKGIAYQEQGEIASHPNDPRASFLEPSDFIDPLALPDACRRDLPYLQQLGVNTLRVYSVGSRLNHDDCMNLLSQAGIYVTIDLSLPLNGSIDRTAPAWSTNVLDLYTSSIDVFEKYDNVLAYNIGNEVVDGLVTQISPYVKAAARDIKAYLSSNLDDTSIDLFGLNNYEWCGSSGSYRTTTNHFSNYNVALYFSEYGCIRNRPRTWAEVAGLFSAETSTVWSGGIAFSYFPRESVNLGNYGMVTISDDNKTVTPSAEFENLRTAYSAVTFVQTPPQSSSPASTYPSCPAQDQVFLASTTLPGTPSTDSCACLDQSLSCRFIITDSNYSKKLGETIDIACKLLGERGENCDDIGGDGQAGVYGRIAGCHPLVKASYIMSKYYESTDRDPGACSFGGNGTIASTTLQSGLPALAAAASSCIPSHNAVFVPKSVSTGTTPSGNGGNGGNGGGNTGGNNTGGASSLRAGSSIMVGLSIVTAIATVSGVLLTV
ncbi:hypothetical protein CVT24_010446 [Panaeolus cyanescens]|uniref:1,3-beta-glucanosyltransferase n=1 Tax=Panaeolus cyanescens TaxID=181874 RepID=A0A409YPQ1_9AGAR|nr:hypothetical protein CVT24_010446 [Panaeolus cyanescens]